MYKIGDRVVYPMHGAGVIEAIEEKEILGSIQKYYVMKMPVGDMKVMIPMETCDEIGIRSVIDGKEAEKVLKDFSGYEIEEAQSWNKRYRENMMRIKSGDVYEVAHVVKMLISRDRAKGLSTGERKMLSNAKQILISELVLAKNAKQSEVETIIEELV
ncbi:MAG: CarD family transcriptional regulator [Clostridia bacterium]|nr:CarD family transcriptional regulator [Clostridia bacterium]